MRRQAELPLIVRAQTAALARSTQDPVALTLLVHCGSEICLDDGDRLRRQSCATPCLPRIAGELDQNVRDLWYPQCRF
jgi:hypothetical protein